MKRQHGLIKHSQEVLPGSVVPAVAAMGMEELNNLTQAVEREIGSELQNYIEGDEQVYPMSVQIALAYKH